MIMTNADVKACIDYAGGPEYILGFRFANGYKLAYSPRGEGDTNYRINPNTDLIEIGGTEYLKFEHHDFNGRPAYSLIPTECINQVYYMTDAGIRMRDIME